MQLGDDTVPEVRRQGAVRATTVMLGVGIGADGQRELLELHLAYGETEGGWHGFIERLRQEGSPECAWPPAMPTKGSAKPYMRRSPG